MRYTIGKSNLKDIQAAVIEATQQLNQPKLIIFNSPVAQFEAYTQQIYHKFPHSIVIGSTSYTGLCHEGAFKDSLIVLGIEEGIICYGDVLEEIHKYPLKYVSRVEKIMNEFSDFTNVVCFELATALLSSEEIALTTLNTALENKNIPVFGGSAGDQGNANKTLVSLNGQVYKNACVFVMIKNLGGKVKFYRENIYKKIGIPHIATKVDVKNRIVYEYDHRPAAEVMANDLGISVNQLEDYLNEYPWGRIIGDEMFIMANLGIRPDGAIIYHARVYKNAQMVLLAPDDYKKVIPNTLKKIKEEIPNPSLTLMVNCICRSILFENEGYFNTFVKQVHQTVGNFIGFSGYGEQLNEQHFNQTMVLAVFE